mmetsp:Transcript_48342/g.104100  ORF Transcript_48342/g.104100 Transcript_48342/m.104100 type:complete len:633 (+) Transcript_48342:94-1992(+)
MAQPDVESAGIPIGSPSSLTTGSTSSYTATRRRQNGGSQSSTFYGKRSPSMDSPAERNSGTEPEVEPMLQPNTASPESGVKLAQRKKLLQSANHDDVLLHSLDVSIATQRLLTWFGMLENEYGSRLLLLLFSAQHLLKGVVQQFQASAIMWILMEYRIGGPQLQIYTSVAGSAWAFKPILGAISDFLPIFGYRKAPYVVITSLIGVACTTCIGLSTHETSSVEMVVACFFGMSLQAATADLLTEAKYSEHLHENPEHGPDLITFVWGGISIGNMIAIAVVGWLITTLGPRSVFLTCIFPTSAILYPAFANYFQETPMTREEVQEVQAKYIKQGEIVFLCGLMTVLTIFLSAIGTFSDSQDVHFIAAISVITFLMPSFYVLLRPEIAKMNTFFVLQAATSLNIGGATFYFYTDSVDEYPDGPHFTAAFFATTLGFVASFMSLVGLTTYTQYMKDWTYRSLIFVSNILVTLLSLLDVAMFLRLNLRLGIPDTYFVMGSSVATVVIRQWQWMPGVVVMSQLCPQGMEATMFALLAGCANIGSQVSDYLGAYLLWHLGVHPSGAPNEGAQFENLWKASLVSTLLPAITILLIPVFIPQAKQTDKLLLNDTTSATAGSLMSRWIEWRTGRSPGTAEP